MGFLHDNNGERSLMRLITLLIVGSGLLWGFIEVIIYVFYPTFDIHETLILTTISIGVTGKGTQKAIEVIKKSREKEAEKS